MVASADRAQAPLGAGVYAYTQINGAMLGRTSRDARHSLAQLVATLSDTADDPTAVFVSIYSYRSLLLYRLAAKMPLPPALGLLAARTLVSTFTFCDVHFPDASSPGKYIDVGGQNDIARKMTWNFLPAKGPTLTIMAQARLTAQAAVAEIRTEGSLRL